METMKVSNPHGGKDELSQSPDRKGKRIIADPDWMPPESEDQQQLQVVENDSYVQGEELLPGEGTESDCYDQFHVEPGPQRSYNPRRNVHQVSGDDNKKLPTLGAIHDWVNSGKLRPCSRPERPCSRPERPLPIPQPIQPLPAPGWAPQQGCRPATNESNIFEQFDAVEVEDAGDNKPIPLNYFCLLGPCFEKGIPGKGMQDLKIHRRAVHQIHSHSDNIKEQLPHGWDVREWVNMGKPRPYVPETKKPRKSKARSSDAGNTEQTAPDNAMATVQHSVEMKPKCRRKRATKVESDDSAQPPVRQQKRVTKSAPTTLHKAKRKSSVVTKHADPIAVSENVDPDLAGMEHAIEKVNPVAITAYFDPDLAGIEIVNPFAAAGVQNAIENVDPNAEAAYEDDSEDVDPDVDYLEDSDEEDTESPDLPGEENFLNVNEFSLNHESYELAASASMEYWLMKSSHPHTEQMESSHHLLKPMESLHHRFEPMESLHHRSEPMQSSLHHLEPMGSSHHLLNPMRSSYHNPDYNDNNVDKYLSSPTGMGENKPPFCTGANYESNIVFGHTFGPPIPNEQRMIPLGVLNPSFDIPKEHSICKHPPIPQAAAIAGQATSKRDTYCEFDVIEHDGKLKFSCLLPDCLGNDTHPTTRRELLCHWRDYHQDISPSLPGQSSIVQWLSLGKPRPYIQKAVSPRKRSHSKVGVHIDSKLEELPKGPLAHKIKPLLPNGYSLESLQLGVVATGSLLTDSSMVARTSPDSLEDPLVSPTSLATLGGQVVAATGPTSFKGPVLSATTLDTLEDHVVLVATTPSSVEVTNPPSFDVLKVASPSPDSIGDSATQPSLEGLQVEAFDLGQGVDGDHEKETNTSHMMAQELSDGQVDSNQAAPKASAPDALMLFLEDLDHEENELCMYTPSSGEQEKDEQSIFSEQAMKEFDRALFDL